jgi:hypothetical protein
MAAMRARFAALENTDSQRYLTEFFDNKPSSGKI